MFSSRTSLYLVSWLSFIQEYKTTEPRIVSSQNYLPPLFYAQWINQLIHQESVFIVTDSVIQIPENHIDDVLRNNFLTVIPAIPLENFTLSPQMLKNLIPSMSSHYHRESLRYRPFIIINVSLTEKRLINMLHKFAHVITDYSNTLSDKWLPTALILWPEEFYNKSIYQQFTILETAINQAPLSALTMDMLMFFAFTDSKAGKIVIWETYRVKNKKIISLVASLNVRDRYFCESGGLVLEAYVERRRNFHMQKLTASVKGDDFATNDWAIIKSRDGALSVGDSYMTYLYRDLQRLLNFSQNVVMGDSPVLWKNGSMTGVTVDQLNSDEADISLTELSFSPERAKALTFLTPTHTSLAYVFFKQPPPNSLRDFVVAPFKTELWIALIGTWMLIVLSVKFQALVTNSKKKGDGRFINEVVLWGVGTLCQKSWYMSPDSNSLRMKLLFGSLMGIIVYTAYSAFIVSSLAVTSIPIKAFQDLYNHPRGEYEFTFTTHEGSHPFQGLLKGYITAFGLQQKVETVSTENEISHLFNGNFKWEQGDAVVSSKKAFLSYADLFYKVARFQNYSNEFVCNHVSYFPLHVGYLTKSSMLVKKGSRYKETLNYMLLHLKAVGLIHRNNQGYNAKYILKCIPPEENLVYTAEPAAFKDIITVTVILLMGIIASLLVLTLEKALYTFNHLQYVESFLLTVK